MNNRDIIIIGAGIAGASAAYFLALGGANVVLLEREEQPGYHSTGRSAALFSETYGPTIIRRLSMASRAFLAQPPEGFAEHALLSPRGMLMVATEAEAAELAAFAAEIRANGGEIRMLDADEVVAQVPVMRRELLVGGVLEPGAMDIDVHALHWGFIRGFRHAGGTLVNEACVERIGRRGARWVVEDARGRGFEADVVVNAAGAWADEIAQRAGVLPCGLVPKRRTALMVDLPAGVHGDAWPMVCSITEDYYFKPDAGRLLVSPADETPVAPQDVQPEDLDVAIAIDRFMTATTVEVRRPGSTWAGLRSFFADGDPVSGFAPDAPGFYWLAGQGGYGIQTAPAMGRVAAGLILQGQVPDDVGAFGIAAEALSPARLAG